MESDKEHAAAVLKRILNSKNSEEQIAYLLQEKYCGHRISTLNVSNAVKILNDADKYNLLDIRHRSLDVICASFDTIPSTDIQQIDHRCLEQILKSDKIQATEELVFKRLMEWYERDRIERRKLMANLLKCIRLQHISGQFLVEHVDAAFKKFNCSKLVTEEYQKRALNPTASVCRYRCQPLCAVFHDMRIRSLRVEKYNFESKGFEFSFSIKMRHRTFFETVWFENKLIIIGGWDKRNKKALKSVRKIVDCAL